METDPALEPARILVVDDQTGVRLTLKGILSKKGYQVSMAENGEEALEMARQEPFRVIFMDVKMPGLNGVETYIKMKEINPDAAVIMMTGYALEDDLKKAIQEGAYAIVYKPFDMNKILVLLDECLGNRPLIMVVDDRMEDRRLLKEILGTKGYRVVEASSGIECLEKVKERGVQIILLDVKMPGMDGVETLKQVKEIRPDVGVIMVTGHSVEEMIEEALRYGSFSSLRKPFDIGKLIKVMDECLKRKPAHGK